MSTPMVPGIVSGMNARGPLSSVLLQIFVAGNRETTAHEELTRLIAQHRFGPGGVIHDDDAQLTLFMLYGLHYGWLGMVGDDLSGTCNCSPSASTCRRGTSRSYGASQVRPRCQSRPRVPWPRPCPS